MHPHDFLRWLEPFIGAALMLLALLDLFLTVLYARAGAGFISDHVARSTWQCFRILARFTATRKAIVLSLSGSAIVVALIVTWATILTLGAALIMHPFLGTSVRGSEGSGGTDFFTALYAGGTSMSLVGAGDFSPRTTGFRVVYLFNSLIGMSVMSLALTYVMQIYDAVQSRNTFGLSLHMMSCGTADAAVLIQRLAPGNKFSAAHSSLGTMADSIVSIRESHDFYPVLFYFRFPEARYSASRTTLVLLDTVSLLRAAVPDDKAGWIKESASLWQLWEASLSLLKTLQHTFTPGADLNDAKEPGADARERWRQRFMNALDVLRKAGIQTVASDSDAAQAYVEMRAQWDHHVREVASYMEWSMSEIDPATNDS